MPKSNKYVLIFGLTMFLCTSGHMDDKKCMLSESHASLEPVFKIKMSHENCNIRRI